MYFLRPKRISPLWKPLAIDNQRLIGENKFSQDFAVHCGNKRNM
jgi:hypothetical protein